MWGAISSDLMKFRKTWIIALVVLGPVGVVSLNGVHYALRYGELVHAGSDNWGRLIQNINFLLIPALVLGLTLLASLIVGLEFQGTTWKLLFALPVPRYKLYLSKFFWLIVLLACSGALIVVGTFILGWLLGLQSPIPVAAILQEGFAPYAASYALVGLQLLLSVLIANQAVSICVGILGVIASLASNFGLIPNWVPWVYPGLAAAHQVHATTYVVSGILLCAVLLVFGTITFSQRQVH